MKILKALPFFLFLLGFLATALAAPSKKGKENIPEDVLKARSEAQLALSSAYTAERAFHAEHKRYSTDLKAIGFKPMESGKEFYYKAGFLKSYAPKKLATFDTFTETPDFSTTDHYFAELTEDEAELEPPVQVPESRNIDLNKYKKFCKANCTANSKTFEIILVRPISEDRQDVWLINHKKELTLACDGLKKDCST